LFKNIQNKIYQKIKATNFLLLVLVISTILITKQSEAYEIRVKNVETGTNTTLDVEAGDTILSVKIQIQNEDGISSSRQSYTFGGTTLNDIRTLSDYNIQVNSTILMTVALDSSSLNNSLSRQLVNSNIFIQSNFINSHNNNVQTLFKDNNKTLKEIKFYSNISLANINFKRNSDIDSFNPYVFTIGLSKNYHNDEIGIFYSYSLDNIRIDNSGSKVKSEANTFSIVYKNQISSKSSFLINLGNSSASFKNFRYDSSLNQGDRNSNVFFTDILIYKKYKIMSKEVNLNLNLNSEYYRLNDYSETGGSSKANFDSLSLLNNEISTGIEYSVMNKIFNFNYENIFGLNYHRNFSKSDKQYIRYSSDNSNPTNIDVNPLPVNIISLKLESKFNNNLSVTYEFSLGSEDFLSNSLGLSYFF